MGNALVIHTGLAGGFRTLNDENIEIENKTNKCYIVPTLDFGGNIRIHKEEGSFINALLKILDGFEEKIKNSKTHKLTNKEESYLIYSIFAMFDFLPLPKHYAELAKNIDPKHHRYSKEPLNRLIQVAAQHLLFIFESYPNITFYYFDKVVDGFLYYVSDGVKLTDLCKIMEVSPAKDSNLATKFSQAKKEKVKVTVNFINEKLLAANPGFKQQYPKESAFDKKLKEGVHATLNEYRILHEKSKDYEEKLKKEYQDEPELQVDMDVSIIDLLYKDYITNVQTNENYQFKNLIAYESSLGIDLKAIYTAFIKASEEIKNIPAIKSKNKSIIAIIHTVLSTDNEQVVSIVSKILYQAIKSAYFALQQPCDVNMLKDKLKNVKDIYKKYKESLNQLVVSTDTSFDVLDSTVSSGTRDKFTMEMFYSRSSLGYPSTETVIPSVQFIEEAELETPPSLSKDTSPNKSEEEFSEEDPSQTLKGSFT